MDGEPRWLSNVPIHARLFNTVSARILRAHSEITADTSAEYLGPVGNG